MRLGGEHEWGCWSIDRSSVGCIDQGQSTCRWGRSADGPVAPFRRSNFDSRFYLRTLIVENGRILLQRIQDCRMAARSLSQGIVQFITGINIIVYVKAE